jgi:VIT1/CCC1 family predicted Fe2+/Mn2+ transporter
MRAAVLGANDGIVSTASLIVGVAAAGATQHDMMIAGVAGLVGGAMSMAAGEYVSVSTQSDSETADIAREKTQLIPNSQVEHEELANIYVARGVEPGLARQVAAQLMAKDALAAHARDELGISSVTRARPAQAAVTSAVSFAVGALLPLLMVLLTPVESIIPVVFTSALFFLAALGAGGARTGGASMLRPIVRVVFWGALALAITAAIGAIFGAVA